MNITHDVVVDGVELTVEAVHTTSEGDAQRMHVEVFRDGELIGSQRIITKPTGHFVTDDGMVDTTEPCNCDPNAACSNCPSRPDFERWHAYLHYPDNRLQLLAHGPRADVEEAARDWVATNSLPLMTEVVIAKLHTATDPLSFFNQGGGA